MSKNILFFFGTFLIISASNPLIAMGSDDESPVNQKTLAEKQSPCATAGKKTKKKKQSPSAASGAATAIVQSQLAQITASNLPAIEANAPVAAARPKVSATPLQSPEVDELEGNLPPQLNQAAIEVELDQKSHSEWVQRKLENYMFGTDTYLLDRLAALKPNEVIAPNIDNQKVILSAVNNLIRKENLDNIQKFLKFAKEKKIKVDETATSAMGKFLHDHQAKLFAALFKTYLEKIKPITQIADLIDNNCIVRGEQPSQEMNLTSLSRVNVKALDKIMHDMAGRKHASAQDQKHNAH